MTLSVPVCIPTGVDVRCCIAHINLLQDNEGNRIYNHHIAQSRNPFSFKICFARPAI